MLRKLLEYDRELFVYLNGLGVEKYDLFWSTVTRLYVWIPFFLFIFYLIFRSFSKSVSLRILGVMALLAAVCISFTETVRVLVGRLRPVNDPDLNTIIRILQSPSNFSFFSGHAANSFALTTFVYLVMRNKYRWCFLFYLWPLIFSASRIYVGVHFPSDILAGTLLGSSLGYLFYILFRKRLLDPAEG